MFWFLGFGNVLYLTEAAASVKQDGSSLSAWSCPASVLIWGFRLFVAASGKHPETISL